MILKRVFHIHECSVYFDYFVIQKACMVLLQKEENSIKVLYFSTSVNAYELQNWCMSSPDGSFLFFSCRRYELLAKHTWYFLFWSFFWVPSIWLTWFWLSLPWPMKSKIKQLWLKQNRGRQTCSTCLNSWGSSKKKLRYFLMSLWTLVSSFACYWFKTKTIINVLKKGILLHTSQVLQTTFSVAFYCCLDVWCLKH